MAKSQKSKSNMSNAASKDHESPLIGHHKNMISAITKNKKEKARGLPSKSSKKAQKRARKEAQEDLEESQLTEILFGSGVVTDNNEDEPVAFGKSTQHETQQLEMTLDPSKDNAADFAFEIDRTGQESENDEFEPIDQIYEQDDDDDEDFESKSVSDDGDDSDDDHDAPAWEDPDDATTKLVDASYRLKKLRKTRKETKALSSHELEQRLRERYESTAQVTARTDWASAKRKTQQQSMDEVEEEGADEDDPALALFSSSQSLLASSRNRLPPNVLDIVRCPDANQADPNKAVVRAVNFHPGSDPEQPLVLTAGLDKTLRFFQVGEEKSEKIHGIHFPKMPIYSASFLGNTGKVVLSGRRSFFYLYDAIAGKVDYVPRILGRDEKSWEKHTVSPDGQLIAFVGNDGYVVLVDTHSKQCVGTLKLNGSVRAITFTPDGSCILTSGSDGDIYRWDVKSRRCLERFPNGDGTITSALAASSSTLAVGAESGVVNLYSEYEAHARSSLLGGVRTKQPLKSIMNLHTSADFVRFNTDGQILALSTQRDKHGLKLLHVPSKTIFSNWPTSKTPLGYVWGMDFSPQSKFLAVGNDKGKCLLYKLKHYNNDYI